MSIGSSVSLISTLQTCLHHQRDHALWRNVWRITSILGGAYGVGFLLTPNVLFGLSQDGGIPANAGWVRLAGGMLIGLAVGAWLAGNASPAKLRPLVTTFGVSHGLIALSLTYSVLSGEYRGIDLFMWTSIALNAAICVAMIWLLNKFRAVL